MREGQTRAEDGGLKLIYGKYQKIEEKGQSQRKGS